MIRHLPWAINAIHFATLALFTTLALVASPAAWATPDGDALAERLAVHAPSCGRFEQARWLADLEARLDSRGHFERKENGLVWQTTAPVRDRVILSEDNDDLPLGFQVIAPVLGDLLSGNWQGLERHFTIELSGTQEDWQARLTPNDTNVAERLSQLLVHGRQQVEQVELEFADGDRLDLALTAADCERLEDGDRQP